MYVRYFTKLLNWYIIQSSTDILTNEIEPLIVLWWYSTYFYVHIIFTVWSCFLVITLFYVRTKLNNPIIQYSQLKFTYNIGPLQIYCYNLQSWNILFSNCECFFKPYLLYNNILWLIYKIEQSHSTMMWYNVDFFYYLKTALSCITGTM